MDRKQMREWIDGATYEELLSRWRFAPAGDPMFCGEIGDYYTEVIRRKRDELPAGEAVRTSRAIGW
jgi:hypothetical protein